MGNARPPETAAHSNSLLRRGVHRPSGGLTVAARAQVCLSAGDMPKPEGEPTERRTADSRSISVDSRAGKRGRAAAMWASLRLTPQNRSGEERRRTNGGVSTEVSDFYT